MPTVELQRRFLATSPGERAALEYRAKPLTWGHGTQLEPIPNPLPEHA